MDIKRTDEQHFEKVIAERIAATAYIVEADSFAQHSLWEKWASEDYPRTWPALTWEQMNPGSLRAIGHVGDRPVCVCMTWARVGCLLVCFIDATSAMQEAKSSASA
jgi:hypothetical protein